MKTRASTAGIGPSKTPPGKNSNITKLRKKLRGRISSWRVIQQELLGNALSIFQSDSGLDLTNSDEPEREKLYLPSDLTRAQLDEHNLTALSIVELTLRQGRMYDAIRAIQFARKAVDALNRDKNRNAWSQSQKIQASTKAEVPERIINSEIANYSACRAALITLGGSSYVEALPVLTVQDAYRKSTHLRRQPGDSKVNNGRIYNTGVTAGARVRPIRSLQHSSMETASGAAAIVGTQGSKAKPRMCNLCYINYIFLTTPVEISGNDKQISKDRKGENIRRESIS